MGSLPKPKPLPPEGIELNLPQGDMDVQYKMVFYNLLRKLGDVISFTDKYTDIRIPILTELIIATVTDDKIFSEIKNRLETFVEIEVEKEKIEKKITVLDNDSMGRCKIAACMNIIHEVVAFYDIYEGITHKLVVGEI